MSKQLTAAGVARLKADGKRREVPDGGCAGLHLVIQPSGVKSFALRFRRGGRSAKLTLGRADLDGKETSGEPVIGQPLTLAQARQLAAAVHRQRALGRDVVADRRREKLEKKTQDANTFADAAAAFIEQHAMRKTRRWHATARLLGLQPAQDKDGLELIRHGLADRWRDRPITEISVADVRLLISEAREKGVPGLERRNKGPSVPRSRSLFAALSKFFSWCVDEGRIAQSPCVGLSRPEAPRPRSRALAEPELIEFWQAASREPTPFAQLLKLLLLTGQRLGEVAGMRRDELSDDGTSWTLPASRTKNHRIHLVPLAPLARSILKTAGTDGDLVFTTTGTTPPSGWSKLKRRLDEAMAEEREKRTTTGNAAPWRLHDLRRSAATGMAKLGIQPHVIEAVLNHVSGFRGGVAGVYNVFSYLPEKTEALMLWAAHVELLVVPQPAKVARRRKAEA